MSGAAVIATVGANALRSVKHAIEGALFRVRDETHRFGDTSFTVHIADKTAALWYGHDWDKPTDFALLAGHGLQPGARVFDLGAHQGVIAMMLAQTVGPAGAVIAVEANARNNAIGMRNASVNGLNNIRHLFAAVARNDGPILFSARANGAVALSKLAYKPVKVEGVSIDTLSTRYGFPDLVYLDIEGFEVEALKGAPLTLRSSTSWLIEAHGDAMLAPYGACNADIVAFFGDDFSLFWSPNNETTPFAPLDRARGLPPERVFLIAIKIVATGDPI